MPHNGMAEILRSTGPFVNESRQYRLALPLNVSTHALAQGDIATGDEIKCLRDDFPLLYG